MRCFSKHTNDGMIEIEYACVDFLVNDFQSMGERKKDLNFYELDEAPKHITPNPRN